MKNPLLEEPTFEDKQDLVASRYIIGCIVELLRRDVSFIRQENILDYLDQIAWNKIHPSIAIGDLQRRYPEHFPIPVCAKYLDARKNHDLNRDGKAYDFSWM